MSTYSFVALIALFCTGCFGHNRMPSPMAERVNGGDVVGVHAKALGGGSFVWVVPTETGVVLVDAGQNAKLPRVMEELDGRTVHAVLLTHGHFDHVKGLRNFPEAQVYAGPGEGPLVRREVRAGSVGARMATALLGGKPYIPPRFREFDDGEILEIDGAQFTALHLPGHTGGGAAYVWGDVAFTGDAVMGRGEYMSRVPRMFYDDFDQVPESMSRVLDTGFERLADGHQGLHDDARQQLQAFVDDDN